MLPVLLPREVAFHANSLTPETPFLEGSMKTAIRIVLAALMVSALTACGGFSSGLPKNTKVNELSNDQAVTLCRKQSDYMEKHVDTDLWQKVVCYSIAVAFSGFFDDAAEGCQGVYDSCMNPEPGEGTTEDHCADATPDPCTGTVGEYEVCVEEIVAAIAAYIPQANSNLSFSCEADKLDADAAWMTANTLEDPQSCEDFDATCEEEGDE
jgi:hypothetical protein